MFLFYDFSHMKMFPMILVLIFLVRILNGIRGSWIQNYSRTAVAGSVKKKETEVGSVAYWYGSGSVNPYL